MAKKSIIFSLSGADDSNTAYGGLIEYRSGFVANGLRALYLMQDAAVGQTYSGPIKDSSGYNNNGTIVPGSTFTGGGAGFNATGKGVAIQTPIDYAADSFTIITVQRQNNGQPPSAPSAFFYGSSVGLGGSINNPPNDKSVSLSYDTQGVGAGIVSLGINSPQRAFANTGARLAALQNGDATSYFAVGMSWDKTAGYFVFQSWAGSFTYPDPQVSALMGAAGGKHTVGLWGQGNGGAQGQACLAALYVGVAMSPTDLETARQNAIAVVSARGTQVF